MWIKNILAIFKKNPEKIISEVKAIDRSRPKIQTVDIFKSEPWLKEPAERAIRELHVPWECSQEKIDEAKSVALEAFFNGFQPKQYADTLSPSIFKTKREAQHAMVKIIICASSSVDRFRVGGLGLTKFRWMYIEHLCDFPKHQSYGEKIYTYKNGAKGDWPGKNYGCRCWSSPIFDV